MWKKYIILFDFFCKCDIKYLWKIKITIVGACCPRNVHNSVETRGQVHYRELPLVIWSTGLINKKLMFDFFLMNQVMSWTQIYTVSCNIFNRRIHPKAIKLLMNWLLKQSLICASAYVAYQAYQFMHGYARVTWTCPDNWLSSNIEYHLRKRWLSRH